MSAKDNMQPKQLQMFMTPDELHAEVKPTDFDPDQATWDDPRRDWGRKLRRAKGVYDPETEYAPTPGLYEDIAKNGIQRPVPINHDYYGDMELGDGHHRVATATDLARQGREVYIPVTHTNF